jgi:hypothetical protein
MLNKTYGGIMDRRGVALAENEGMEVLGSAKRGIGAPEEWFVMRGLAPSAGGFGGGLGFGRFHRACGPG